MAVTIGAAEDGTALVFALVADLPTPVEASAKPRPENSAVLDFGEAYCELAVHDVHASQLGDVSSHSTVTCYSKQGGGARLRVEQISMTTTMTVLKLQELTGGEIDSCTEQKKNEDSYECLAMHLGMVQESTAPRPKRRWFMMDRRERQRRATPRN